MRKYKGGGMLFDWDRIFFRRDPSLEGHAESLPTEQEENPISPADPLAEEKAYVRELDRDQRE